MVNYIYAFGANVFVFKAARLEEAILVCIVKADRHDTLHACS
jgi:hypothetical protein